MNHTFLLSRYLQIADIKLHLLKTVTYYSMAQVFCKEKFRQENRIRSTDSLFSKIKTAMRRADRAQRIAVFSIKYISSFKPQHCTKENGISSKCGAEYIQT